MTSLPYARELAPLTSNTPEVEAAFRDAAYDTVAEILEGELVVSPRPARAHLNVASNLGALLTPPFRFGHNGPGGWVLLDEPELHLGGRPDKVVPDLAGWRRERMPDAVGAVDAPAAYDLPPDWVCEVLSDRTRRIDLGKKRRIYARERVGHLWYVDPIAQTLDVYCLEEGRWVLLETYEGDGRVAVEPFDAVEIDLALLWSR